MKTRLYALFSLLALFVILTTEIFACACCAERGHYSINVSKPEAYVFDTIKQLEFSSANLYTDAGYPDNIKGIKPLKEKFSSVKAEFGSKVWSFTFRNADNEVGKLNLSKPVSMVSYMVDLDAGDEEKPMVSLYKEWRFKYKVLNATGIFKDGVDKNTSYFLVLRGHGNLCTDASDFTKYRLEISGKKADYSFFGSVSEASSPSSQKTKTTDTKSASGDKFVLGRIKGDYSGCACSLQTYLEAKKSGKWKTINFYQELGENKGAYLNLNGKDVLFKLVKEGKRPEKEKVGDRYSDVFQYKDITVTISYTVSKLPCEECEGTDYDVIISASRGSYLVKERASGSCGC